MWQEFEKEALRKKSIVEKLLESSPLDGDAELAQLTDAWELLRRLEMNRSARLQQALQLVSDVISDVSVKSFAFFFCLKSYLTVKQWCMESGVFGNIVLKHTFTKFDYNCQQRNCR